MQRTSDTTQRPDPASGETTAALDRMTNAPLSKGTIAKGKREIEKKTNQLEVLKVVYVAIGTIKPNAYNPNRQSERDFDLLLRSIEDDGFTQPILVNDGSIDPTLKDRIVDGEHRWRAAQALKMKEVPVVYVPFTQEQMKISTLRHNRARGSEDIDLTTRLMQELQQMGAVDWMQEGLGLSDQEMNRLLADLPAPDANAGEEYTMAWVPSDKGELDRIGNEGRAVDYEDGSGSIRSSTPAAREVVDRLEERLAGATTEDERSQIRRDTGPVRMSFIFTNQEAALLKRILGTQQAERVLSICKYVAEMGVAEEAVAAGNQ